jgi:hypothetical protein
MTNTGLLTNPERIWSSRVSQIFHTAPRDGAKPHSVWFPRRALENDLSDLLFQEAVHICVDGPSGTGKTSLVQTQLSKEAVKVLPLQLPRSTDWGEFCKLIVQTITDVESKLSVEVSATLKNFLPEAAFKLTYGRKSKPTADISATKLGSMLNEVGICRALEASKAILFIDDFEKASADLVIRIADLCKIATQTHKCKNYYSGHQRYLFPPS